MRWIRNWSDGSRVDRDKIKAIQKGMGIEQDGYFGEHTLDRLYREFGKPFKAYSGNFYNAIVITGKPENIIGRIGRKVPHNAISGVFQWESKPTSVLISEGKKYRTSSTHDWFHKPDTVLYFDGKEVRAKRTIYFDEYCQWAIGGVGLHNWNPIAEGYGTHKDKYGRIVGKYSDVLRRTWHTAVGVYPDGYMILVYFRAEQEGIKRLLIDKLNCKYAILLDGGHIAAINCDHGRRNLNQWQNNYIGFKE